MNDDDRMTPAGPADDRPERGALVHRELVQALLLVSAAVLAFFVTRAVAASNREMNARDAAEAFRRGELAMTAGRVDEAASWFQRARARNRMDRQYALALARALLQQGDADAARSLLTVLRESAPDDPDINLALATAAGAEGRPDDAVRYYRNALYASWPPDRLEDRNHVRVALVRVLLAEHRTEAAVGELIGLSSTVADRPVDVLEVADLFRDAGDTTHALQQYERALRLDPANPAALEGAGRAAFAIGDYALAVGYLERARANADISTSLDIARHVLSDDPLGARIGSAERRRRVVSDLRYLEDRLTACRTAAPPDTGGHTPLDEVRTLRESIDSRAASQDALESAVDLTDRIERYLHEHCGPPTTRDRALAIVAARHRGTS